MDRPAEPGAPPLRWRDTGGVPELLEIARANLTRWLATNPSPVLVEWRQMLERAPLPELMPILRSPGADATRLTYGRTFQVRPSSGL